VCCIAPAEVFGQFKMFEKLIREKPDKWLCKTSEEKW